MNHADLARWIRKGFAYPCVAGEIHTHYLKWCWGFKIRLCPLSALLLAFLRGNRWKLWWHLKIAHRWSFTSNLNDAATERLYCKLQILTQCSREVLVKINTDHAVKNRSYHAICGDLEAA